MNLSEIFKFIKIDNDLYTLLQEYKRSGNIDIITTKIKEYLFLDYKNIKDITENFTNKPNLEFFLGKSNEDIFVNIKRRCADSNNHYEVAEFYADIILFSKLSTGKKHDILYEVIHVEKNSRNVYSTSDTERKVAALIIEKVALTLDKALKEGTFKLDVSFLKIVNSLAYDINEESQKSVISFILNEFLKIKDNPKATKKLLSLFDYLYDFINKYKFTVADDEKVEIIKMIFSLRADYGKSIPSHTTNNFLSKLFNVTNIFYHTSIPDELYELLFAPYFIDDIPAYTVLTSGQVTPIAHQLYSNLHLISDREILIDYAQKSFDESLAIIDFYKIVEHNLFDAPKESNREKNEYLRDKGREYNKNETFPKLGTSHGMTWINKYPFSLNGRISTIQFMMDNLDTKKVSAHFYDISASKNDFSYIGEFFTNSLNGKAYFFQFIIGSYSFSSEFDKMNEDSLFMAKYIESQVEACVTPSDISDTIFKEQCVAYLQLHPTFLTAKNERYSFDLTDVNSEKMKYFDFIKKIYPDVLFENVNHLVSHSLSDENKHKLILDFYSIDELIVLNSYFYFNNFIETETEWLEFFNTHKSRTDVDFNFFINRAILERFSYVFVPQIIQLLETKDISINIIDKVIINVMKENPSLLELISEHDFKQEGYNDHVFNFIMENKERYIRDIKSLPFLKEVITTENIKESKEILESVFKELFL